MTHQPLHGANLEIAGLAIHVMRGETNVFEASKSFCKLQHAQASKSSSLVYEGADALTCSMDEQAIFICD